MTGAVILSTINRYKFLAGARPREYTYRQRSGFLSEKWCAHRFPFPFKYLFLDEYFDRKYLPQERQYRVISILSWICIFISHMGVLGLWLFPL